MKIQKMRPKSHLFYGILCAVVYLGNRRWAVAEKHLDMNKEIKKAERRGKRKGFLKRIAAFFTGILVGMLLLTGIHAYMHGKSVVDTVKSFFVLEESAEGHDLTLRKVRFFGYKAADFEEAILGDSEELAKLEVYSREVSDVATLTQTGLGNIEAFSKYQYITYNGKATYTVDLGKLTKDNIIVNTKEKSVTIKVPRPVLEPINIPSENIEFGEVERKSIFAFGDIKLTPEEQAKVETEAKKKMEEKLKEDNILETADRFAKLTVWEMYSPIIKGVGKDCSLEVEFR